MWLGLSGECFIVRHDGERRAACPVQLPEQREQGFSRVSVEDAHVTFLDPDHQLLNFPNKISQADFEGWVQERGLYFASRWDDNYETIIASHDPDEADKAGSILFARYGKGVFIYTGISWFRELPAGVPGAYRLFANLISAGEYDGK